MKANNKNSSKQNCLQNNELKNISTEKRNKNTINIDLVSTVEMLKILNNEDKTVPLAVEKVIPDIAKLVDKASEIITNNGRLIYIGAGTSGRLGVLDASEMPPTYGIDNNVIVGLVAGGDKALRNSIEGIEDSKEAAIKDLKKINLTAKDMVVGIAASGRTPYVVSGLEYAKSLNAETGSIATSSNSLIGKIADYKIEAITGAEPITGSTRMKSGTAQKLILNMISTSIMIKQGKTYGNLMVDVKALNSKLVKRSINIVTEITNEDASKIVFALEQCNYSPKIAIVMLVLEVDVKQAEQLLLNNNGKLREVLKNGRVKK